MLGIEIFSFVWNRMGKTPESGTLESHCQSEETKLGQQLPSLKATPCINAPFGPAPDPSTSVPHCTTMLRTANGLILFATLQCNYPLVRVVPELTGAFQALGALLRPHSQPLFLPCLMRLSCSLWKCRGRGGKRRITSAATDAGRAPVEGL